jgi:hypothetical protein
MNSDAVRCLIAACLVLAGACGETSSTGSGDGGSDGLVPPIPPNYPTAENVILGSGTTEGALTAMLDATPEFWLWSAGRVHTPKGGEEIPAETPFTFRWASDVIHLHKDAGSEPALSGVAFLVLFSAGDGTNLGAALVLERSFTPPAGLWDDLARHEGPITIDVIAADFDDSAITEFGGPFFGDALTFTLESVE